MLCRRLKTFSQPLAALHDGLNDVGLEIIGFGLIIANLLVVLSGSNNLQITVSITKDAAAVSGSTGPLPVIFVKHRTI